MQGFLKYLVFEINAFHIAVITFHFCYKKLFDHRKGNFETYEKKSIYSVKTDISIPHQWKMILKIVLEAKDFKSNEITHQNKFGSWGKLKRLSHDLTRSIFHKLSWR